MNLTYYWFGIILRSSMSNRRVLSIKPWFRRTKSRALCPWNKNVKFWTWFKQTMTWIACEISQIFYRECRWFWTQLVVVIFWVSKIRWYNYPEVRELPILHLPVPIWTFEKWMEGTLPPNSSGSHAWYSLLKSRYDLHYWKMSLLRQALTEHFLICTAHKTVTMSTVFS